MLSTVVSLVTNGKCYLIQEQLNVCILSASVQFWSWMVSVRR